MPCICMNCIEKTRNTYIRVRFADRYRVQVRIILLCDVNLDRERNLRIRNNGRQQNHMGSAAFGASEPEDSENGRGMFIPDVTPVVSMYCQAGRMTAGTCQLMQLQSMDKRIVYVL